MGCIHWVRAGETDFTGSTDMAGVAASLLWWVCLTDRKRSLRVRYGNILRDHEKLQLRPVLPLARGSNGVTC